MGTRAIEYELAMGSYRREQEELGAMLDRMLGDYGEPTLLPRELRRDLAPKLQGISVSRMITEAR